MMEKTKNSLGSADINRDRLYTYTDNVLDRIGHILSNPADNIVGQLDSVINRSLNFASNSDLQNPEVQKCVFEQVLYFLNGLFKKVNIKKFYNNIPKTNIKKYLKHSLGRQFIHNIYGKEWKLFYRDEIEGSDCYYRTILFKHFFDELKNRGLNLQSDIFFYDQLQRGHSGVIVSFQGEDYVADFSGFNAVCGKMMIQNIHDLNQKTESKNFDIFSRGNIDKYYKTKKTKKKSKSQNDSCNFFPDTDSFISSRSKQDYKSAAVELTSNIDGDGAKNVRIVFFPDRILLKIDGEEIRFGLNTKITKLLFMLPQDKIFDAMIGSIDSEIITSNQGNKRFITKIPLSRDKKEDLVKYLNLIRTKISISGLSNILSS